MSDGPAVVISAETRRGAMVVMVAGEVDLTNADELQRAVEDTAPRSSCSI